MSEGDREIQQPVVNILGEKVALGPLHRGLVPLWVRWINDFEVTRTLAVPMRPTTWESEEAFYEQVTRSESEAAFVIYERPSMRPIGGAGLHRIDRANGTADFGIWIGEKDAWGKGYGTETTRLVLDYAFSAVGLHNVMLLAYAYNERGLAAYRRAGFREIGRRREAHRLGQRLYDVVFMDCLASDVQSSVLGSLHPE